MIVAPQTNGGVMSTCAKEHVSDSEETINNRKNGTEMMLRATGDRSRHHVKARKHHEFHPCMLERDKICEIAADVVVLAV